MAKTSKELQCIKKFLISKNNLMRLNYASEEAAEQRRPAISKIVCRKNMPLRLIRLDNVIYVVRVHRGNKKLTEEGNPQPAKNKK